MHVLVFTYILQEESSTNITCLCIRRFNIATEIKCLKSFLGEVWCLKFNEENKTKTAILDFRHSLLSENIKKIMPLIYSETSYTFIYRYLSQDSWNSYTRSPFLAIPSVDNTSLSPTESSLLFLHQRIDCLSVFRNTQHKGAFILNRIYFIPRNTKRIVESLAFVLSVRILNITKHLTDPII
jgi:hypothetical protein